MAEATRLRSLGQIVEEMEGLDGDQEMDHIRADQLLIEALQGCSATAQMASTKKAIRRLLLAYEAKEKWYA